MLSFNVYIATSIISILVYELGEKVVSERLKSSGLEERKKSIAEKIFNDIKFLIPIINVISAGAYFFQFEEIYAIRKRRATKNKVEDEKTIAEPEENKTVEQPKIEDTNEKLKRLNDLNKEVEHEKVLKKRY